MLALSTLTKFVHRANTLKQSPNPQEARVLLNWIRDGKMDKIQGGLIRFLQASLQKNRPLGRDVIPVGSLEEKVVSKGDRDQHLPSKDIPVTIQQLHETNSAVYWLSPTTRIQDLRSQVSPGGFPVGWFVDADGVKLDESLCVGEFAKRSQECILHYIPPDHTLWIRSVDTSIPDFTVLVDPKSAVGDLRQLLKAKRLFSAKGDILDSTSVLRLWDTTEWKRGLPIVHYE